MKCLAGVCLVVSFGFAQSPDTPQPVTAATSPHPRSWNRIYRDEPYVPLTNEQRLQFLIRRVVYSPGAPVRAVFQAAVDQERNKPEDWGQGAGAYGKRVANRWGRSVMRTSIETGTAAALGYEQRYIQCKCEGIPRRAIHALAMYWVTYNREGKWVPNVPRFGAAIATEYITLSWLPTGYRSPQDATRGLAFQFASGSAVNVWREFSPPLLRKLRKKLPFVD
jgi:hypothetical protein